jgi:hypothetical protein
MIAPLGRRTLCVKQQTNVHKLAAAALGVDPTKLLRGGRFLVGVLRLGAVMRLSREHCSLLKSMIPAVCEL